MKVGMFVTKFPDMSLESMIYGGAERSAYNMAVYLSKKGLDLAVISTSFDSHDHVDNLQDFQIYRYKTNIKLLSTNISLGMLWKPLKHRYDIINVNFDIPPGPFFGLFHSKIKKVPLVVNYRGDWGDNYGSLFRRLSIRFFNKYLIDALLQQAVVIISPTECYINESKFLGKYTDKIVVIPNGININDFDINMSKKECRLNLRLPINDIILLFVGALSPHKGPEILLESFARLSKVYTNIRLVYVGDGRMRDTLKKLSEDLNVERNVEFVGYISDIHKKAMYYKSSDIFVLPTTGGHEIFGNVNLEAMASGIPIVASNIGGVPDLVIDRENGLLVPPNNIDQLSNAISTLINDNTIRERMGDKGKEMSKLYSWDYIAEETKKVYQELVQSSNHSIKQ